MFKGYVDESLRTVMVVSCVTCSCSAFSVLTIASLKEYKMCQPARYKICKTREKKAKDGGNTSCSTWSESMLGESSLRTS